MAKQLAHSLMRSMLRSAISICISHWSPYSRLIPVGDNGKWVIGHEMREVANLADKIGIKIGPIWVAIHGRKQAVFLGNHFDLLLSERWFHSDHRLATAYFHGKPGQGVKEFDKCFESLTRNHQFVHRVQVSCKSMYDCVLKTGINPEKLHHIPIGINPAYFSPQTRDSRIAVRELFGIPLNAFVVGSFQKDGNGWGEGLEPKMIKGPDVLIRSMCQLKKRVPSLIVFLSGPARGFVKHGLKEAGIPYIHHMMKRYSDVGTMYHALDAYVISSREEGGPKSVLESMASGVPLISTRVGQAVDLVSHGINGWLADVEDSEELADLCFEVLNMGDSKNPIVEAGIATATCNSYEAQQPLWKKYFDGFVQ